MRSSKQFLLIFLILVILTFSFGTYLININEIEIRQNQKTKEKDIKNSGYWELSPLIIDDSGGEDYTWAEATSEQWCSGNGTWSNPYLLENITIDIEGAGTSGITIKYSDVYFQIKNITIFNGVNNFPYSGIRLINTSNGLIYNTTISQNYYGIYLQDSCNNNSIIKNDVSNNYDSGIHLRTHSHDNSIINNTILNTNWGGIYFYNDCDRNVLHKNYIEMSSGNAIIFSEDCDFNIIKDNYINGGRGIEIKHENCGDNMIYLNNIPLGVGEDNGIGNFWDNGSIGNKWDQAYSGVDANDDGIGDSAYSIPGTGNAEDQFPIYRDQDDIAPEISIYLPSQYDLFGTEAPVYDVEISDQTLNSTWYRLWNGSTFSSNQTFAYSIDTKIDQDIWQEVGNGTVMLTFFANDSLGRLAYKNTTVRKDVLGPLWVEAPSDQTIEYGTPFISNVSASDPSGVELYWINDSIHFQIDNNGTIVNKTSLSVGNYWIEIGINDTLGNSLTSIIRITIQDTIKPKWAHNFVDQTIEYNTRFIYDVNATDLSEIEMYWINDSVHFRIDDDGIISNATILPSEEYWLEVRAYDPYGNYVSETFKITVESPEQVATPPSSIPGYSLFLFCSILSISISMMLIRKKIKF